MVYGTIQAWRAPNPGVPNSQFGASTAPVFGHVIYIAIAAFVLNVAVAVTATLVFRAVRLPAGADETLPQQYTADPGPSRPGLCRRPRRPGPGPERDTSVRPSVNSLVTSPVA